MATELPPRWPWSKTHLGPPVDPENAWAVYEGGLYFNFNQQIRGMWLQDPAKYVAAANSRFYGWFNITDEPFNTHCYPGSDLCLN